MNFEDLCATIESLIGPIENMGMVGELVSTVQGLVEGGQDLPTAVVNTIDEMRRTLRRVESFLMLP